MCLLSPSLTQKWSLHSCGEGTLSIPGILILEIEETYCKGSEENELSQSHSFLALHGNKD